MDVPRLAQAQAAALACCVCIGVLAGEVGRPEGAPAPKGELTLADALQLTACHSARLAGAAYGVEAAEGRAWQARLWPNPELDMEVEDLAGTRTSSALGEAVTTVRIGQVIDVGSRRRARAQAAAAEVDSARWGLRQQRADLHLVTTKAFTAVLAAQERLRLEEAAVTLAERLASAVAERVQAGKDAASELSKANVAVVSRRLERRRAENALQAARLSLAVLWSGDAATFTRAAGDLAALPDLPDLDRLIGRANDGPDVARRAAELARGQAAVAEARAGRRSPVTVAVGSAWAEADDQATFLVSVSMPLPLFDRNQGAIRAAYADLHQAEQEQRAAQSDLRAAIVARHQDLAAARQEAAALAAEMLPGAASALDAARLAHAAGKAGYLDVLDAQQTLFEAQVQQLDALMACQDAVADLERMTGQTLTHQPVSEE